MGADLILAKVEIDRDRIPNWRAAEDHLLALSDEDCEGICQEESFDDDTPRERLARALQEVQMGWSDELRTMTVMYGKNTAWLIAGDMSYGDISEEISSLCLFDDSGMARAAGFFGYEYLGTL
jgi:hypothetical protein